MRRIITINFLIVLCAMVAIPSYAQQGYHQTVIKEGIQVDFTLSHVNGDKPQAVFREGDHVKFSFSISDTITGKPLSGAFPAAWMDKEVNNGNADCSRKIISFIEGGLLSRPELDLNVYYVLTLNEDNTINVVDPLFGFGGSKLLAQIQLLGTGYDWAVSADQMHVYVTMPEVNQVAIINTSDMTNTDNIAIPGQPKNIVLQEDGRYMWVSYDLQGNFEAESGIAVIDTETKTLIKTISTGKGPHEILISEDQSYAFVSNQNQGSISVIDVQLLQEIKEIKVKDVPHSMAFSAKANALYVVNKMSAVISVIDAKNLNVVSEIQAEHGINKIKFIPDGRLGFVLNPTANTVDIIDGATNRIVQTADVEDQPDDISFTDELAYIRHRGSEIIWMIPLDVVGREGQPVPLVDFNGGQNPPALGSSECPASGIVQAPGANAVLISNYKDESIYYYSEGMAAPSGHFNTYGKRPKAVQVIDKSIEETSSGTYETTIQLRTPGTYDVSLFLDVPSFMECFPVEVLPNAEIERERLTEVLGPLSIHYLEGNVRPIAGENTTFKFELLDMNTQEAVTDLKDVRIMSMSSSGTNHHPMVVKESDSKGVYETNLKFTKEGLYYVYVECLSRGLSYNNPQFLVIYVA